MDRPATLARGLQGNSEAGILNTERRVQASHEGTHGEPATQGEDARSHLEEGPNDGPAGRRRAVLTRVPYDPTLLDTHPAPMLSPCPMSDPRPSVTNVEIYDALVAARGNISEAARALGRPRCAIKQRIDARPELLQLLDDQRESIVDRAEQNKFREVEAGDSAASSFILSTLGASRGYSSNKGAGKDGAIIVEIRQFEETKDGPGEV